MEEKDREAALSQLVAAWEETTRKQEQLERKEEQLVIMARGRD